MLTANRILAIAVVLVLGGAAYIYYRQPGSNTMTTPRKEISAETEIATLGGGCFWCLEAVFEQLKGVERVESGYMGGKIKNPTYEQVCTGTTEHAEVVQV